MRLAKKTLLIEEGHIPHPKTKSQLHPKAKESKKNLMLKHDLTSMLAYFKCELKDRQKALDKNELTDLTTK